MISSWKRLKICANLERQLNAKRICKKLEELPSSKRLMSGGKSSPRLELIMKNRGSRASRCTAGTREKDSLISRRRKKSERWSLSRSEIPYLEGMRSRRMLRNSLTAGLSQMKQAAGFSFRARLLNRLRKMNNRDNKQSKRGEELMLQKWKRQRRKRRKISREWLVYRRRRCNCSRVSSNRQCSHKNASNGMIKLWTKKVLPTGYSRAKLNGIRLMPGQKNYNS